MRSDEPATHEGPDSWFDPTELDYNMDAPDDPDAWEDITDG